MKRGFFGGITEKPIIDTTIPESDTDYRPQLQPLNGEKIPNERYTIQRKFFMEQETDEIETIITENSLKLQNDYRITKEPIINTTIPESDTDYRPQLQPLNGEKILDERYTIQRKFFMKKEIGPDDVVSPRCKSSSGLQSDYPRIEKKKTYNYERIGALQNLMPEPDEQMKRSFIRRLFR